MVHHGRMKKSQAIKLLGGTQSAVGRLLNISRQAVFKWPDPLPRRIEARVRGAIEARRLEKAQRKAGV